MPISKKIEDFMTKASFIRRMFEEGIRMKRELGAENVFDFSLGNPILEPPEAVLERLAELVRDPPPGLHRYMANAGHPDVCERIAAYLSEQSGEKLEAADVIMTTGAAGALNTALKSLLDPGDEVVVVAPFFPEYRFYVDNHGGTLVVAESAGDFDLDIDELARKVGPRTKALILNSPNNPTGRTYTAERLAQLGALLAKREKASGNPITVLFDDPYHKIVFDGLEAPTIFAAHPNSILITSHSKDLGLAGERIGYAAICPRHADRQALRDAITFANRTLGYVNAPSLFQRVVAETQAASVPVAVYQELRDLFCDGLERAGYEFLRPQGAFYIFPKSPDPDDVAFVRVLQKQHILAVPGSGFGRGGYIRLCFCVKRAEIEGALPGFAAAIEEQRRK
ncbi:MAG: pyridoxal phosphate-dependent aminotransferase [Deltaproteobacteria bacterium]|nr:pyridoxal phosphate-dependent aminotransferase [Deltaproteobacteria bacterium]